MIDVIEIEPTLDTLASKEFTHIDYHDSFEVQAKDKSFIDVDSFAKEYFLSQPIWLSIVSMGLSSKEQIIKAIEKSNFLANKNIGVWKIYTRDEKEIVFGDDMGFMEYRFSMFWVNKQRIRVATVVQFKGRFGKYYFSMLKLMHKKFIRISLEAL